MKNNYALDELLFELKVLLSPVQKDIQRNINDNKWPFIFIIGSPRSGTTLLLQWLASLGEFSYPSNLLARFAYAPYIGALIQKIIFDEKYDINNNFYDVKSYPNFSSELGKSEGALATNEFHHFFRNYMTNYDPEYLSEEKLKAVDFIGIKKGLATIESAFNKPFVTKGIMIQYNLLELFKHINKVIFLYIKRKPIYNMQSLLIARKKYFGDTNLWWSVKPKEYHNLSQMDVYHQVAGQVYFTEKSIMKELMRIPIENKIIINYKEFCENPGNLYNTLKDRFSQYNYHLESIYNGPISFPVKNKINLEADVIERLKIAYSFFDIRI